MAKKEAEEGAGSAPAMVRVRVLVDCRHGKCGSVALVDAATLAADQAVDSTGAKVGLHELDPHPQAVASAQSALRAATPI